MRKFKIWACAAICALTGGIYASANIAPSVVDASVNSSTGVVDLARYAEKTAQSTSNTYSSLGTYPLYVDGDAGSTKSLYTIRFGGLSSADPMVTINSGGNYSFDGNTISMSAGSSTSTSKREPYASTAFSVSDNLLQASSRGYLNVTASATAGGTQSYSDKFNFVLKTGTLDGYTNISETGFGVSDTVTSVSSVSAGVSNSKSKDYLLMGVITRSSSGTWRDIGMSISSPTLVISSSDTTAPTISCDINNSWAVAKTLKFTITDTESGIWSVSSNVSNLPTPTKTGNTWVYQIPVTENGNYSITVTDAVGNARTYTHTESKIDKVAPNAVSVDMLGFSTYSEINVKPTFQESGINKETIYYTTDGSVPNTSSKTFLNGVDNKISLADGIHTLKFVVIDEAGNTSEVVTKTIEINTNRYAINISNTNCTIEVIKPTTFDTDDGYRAFYGETIRVNFSMLDGCQRGTLKINGENLEFVEDYVEIIVKEDIVIDVCYDYIVNLSFDKVTFEYLPFVDSQELLYTTNTESDVQILFEIKKNGEVSVLKDAGVYEITWKVDEFAFTGSGSVQVEITPIKVYIEALSGQKKIYGDEDPVSLEYSVEGVPEGVSFEAILERGSGENVGEYLILMKEHNFDSNYVIDYTEEYFKILPRKIIVLADSFEKTYGDLDPEFTYRLYDSSLVGSDVLEGSLTRELNENVGVYEIESSLSNNNYNIIYMKGYLTINPRDIVINIDNIDTIYGNEEVLTYTTDIDVDYSQFSGCLEREMGSDVGQYTISIGTLSSANYNIVQVNNGTYTIGKKLISVNATDVEKVYGESDDLKYEVSGLVSGDTLSGALNRESGESVGVYNISLGSLYNPNYIIDFTPAVLTIKPAGVVIIIENVTQVYGDIEEDLSYLIEGLKFDDSLAVELEREMGSDVGLYNITCVSIDSENYYISECVDGVYEIVKATIVPYLRAQSFVYSGTMNFIDSSNFPFEVNVVYKSNGLEVEGMLNAGTYQVQMIFDGNENYNPAKSEVVDVVVEKQSVYLTLAENKFVYDGNIKFPEFDYNTMSGLSLDDIVFKFEGDVLPQEVGEYRFTITSSSPNYDCTTSGVLSIAKSFKKESSDASSVIESSDATFDSSVANLELVETSLKGKFNDKVLVSACTFANVTEDDDNIYTVKVKAKEGLDSVYVYQLGENNSVRQILVNVVDGYYEFKVDNITDTYILARDKEPLPLWFWLSMVLGVVTIVSASIVTVKLVKKHKAKKSADAPEMENYNVG